MGDTSRHLTYFKVENFKRFESFEMKDLGQFNLIVGDNNVGKTSVLEALLVDSNALHFTCNLFDALRYRNIKSRLLYKDLEFFFRLVALPIRGEAHGVKYTLSVNNRDFNKISLAIDLIKTSLIFTNQLEPNNNAQYGLNTDPSSYEGYKSPFLPFYKGHDIDLTKAFLNPIQKNRSMKNSLLHSLKLFIPDIESIDLYAEIYSDDVLYLTVTRSNFDYNLPLALFGDGTVKMARLLMEIIIHRGKRLMIDEIDTGIHYSRFKEFWRTILLTAKENDVQLFMTTHNQECIRFFKEVLEDDLTDLQQSARGITLVENTKTKQVTAHTYSFEQLEHAINVGNEIRA